jgi:acetyl esterase/lipase
MQIYDFLIQDLHISPENIFIMGRSLGTGVATYLASQKSSAGVILVTPYDSVENVAKGSYWFVPVSILLKNKFESYRYAQLQANSLLCIYG